MEDAFQRNQAAATKSWADERAAAGGRGRTWTSPLSDWVPLGREPPEGRAAGAGVECWQTDHL
eukprot:2137637-Alexandrium_andersonii.AAC.1